MPSDRKLIISRNVRFDESSVLNSTRAQPTTERAAVIMGTDSIQPSNVDLTDQPLVTTMLEPMLPLPQTLPQITPPDCPDSNNHPMPSIAPHQPPNNVLVDQLPAPIVNTRPTRCPVVNTYIM